MSLEGCPRSDMGKYEYACEQLATPESEQIRQLDADIEEVI